MLVTPADIEAAQERVAGVGLRTPLLSAAWASADGRELALKPENLQPVGSFKLRGAYNAIAVLFEGPRPAMIVTHSSGNHARAIAYAARAFGIPATIVMPNTTPPAKVERTRELGAAVELVHPSRRASRADEIVSELGGVLVPPYDDPLVIAGQGTVGAEILADAPDPDVVIVPISGGGLISGVAGREGGAARGEVIGVEPELAADARDGLRSGHRREWPLRRVQRTIADAEGHGDRPAALGPHQDVRRRHRRRHR